MVKRYRTQVQWDNPGASVKLGGSGSGVGIESQAIETAFAPP